MRGKDKAVQQFDKREWKRPNEFICSGLVQFGFVEAVAEYVLRASCRRGRSTRSCSARPPPPA